MDCKRTFVHKSRMLDTSELLPLTQKKSQTPYTKRRRALGARCKKRREMPWGMENTLGDAVGHQVPVVFRHVVVCAGESPHGLQVCVWKASGVYDVSSMRPCSGIPKRNPRPRGERERNRERERERGRGRGRGRGRWREREGDGEREREREGERGRERERKRGGS